MKKCFLLAVALFFATGMVHAQQTTTNKAKPRTKAKAKPTTPRANAEIKALREALDTQQQQIQQLRDEVQKRDANLQQIQQQLTALQTTAAQAQRTAETATTNGQDTAARLTQVQTTVADLSATETKSAAAMQKAEKRISDVEQPAQIHFRGITITPGGFLAANTVFRLHNENADVLDTYGNIPFSGTANSHLSEFRFTARHSRVSLMFEGKIHDWKATGYYEMDFEGAAPTANQVQTNSFQPRIRHAWAQVAMKNGLSFQGGQAWSLLTANRKGISPTTVYIPLTISASYNVGHTYARQTSFRVTKDFNDKAWVAFAVENSETVLGAQLPSGTFSGFVGNFNTTAPGNGFAAGTSTNLGPDLIAKVAFEPGWGHYEIKALGRFFRDRFTATGAPSSSVHTDVTGGGGLGFGIILPVIAKKFDLVLNGIGGRGIGRYGTANGSDVTVRPNGTIVPILSYQTLVGFELHPTSKWDFWLYGGNEYFGRAAYVASSGTALIPVGYGSPLNNLSGCASETAGATCQAQNRDVWQVQPGFWYRIWRGKEGTVQYGMSYSYVHRRPWAGTGGKPVGINNIVMTSFRYYLP